jgi:hypothetical protein
MDNPKTPAPTVTVTRHDALNNLMSARTRTIEHFSDPLPCAHCAAPVTAFAVMRIEPDDYSTDEHYPPKGRCPNCNGALELTVPIIKTTPSGYLWKKMTEDFDAPLVKPQPKSNGRIGGFEI